MITVTPWRFAALKSVTIPASSTSHASMIRLTALVAGIVLVVLILVDAFETVVLPRRVARRSFRLTAWFYRNTWKPWSALAQYIETPPRREAMIGYFGPLSLIFLLALWALGLIFGFALLQYGIGSEVRLGSETVGFWTIVYMSGETFFTLGFGDVTPIMGPARILAVMESGMGFAFLGITIGYIPVIYSSFSAREIEISLLDARAGSPPSAAEFLTRMAGCQDQELFDNVLHDWERWSAQVLENHISYPVLGYFRSQHSNQSWLGALTTILDASTLVMAGVDRIQPNQARLTFAAARHAVVDLAQVMGAQYMAEAPDRLSPSELQRLREKLAVRGIQLRTGNEDELSRLRSLYEPYAQALATRLRITLPPFLAEPKKDNWQGGPWDKLIQAKGLAGRAKSMDDHF